MKLKILCFLTKTANNLCSSEKVVKEIFQYQSFYDFYFFQKRKLLQKIAPSSSAIDAGES
jgi:hypothetical protein